MQVFVDTCVSETVVMQSCDFGDGRVGHVLSSRLIKIPSQVRRA